MQILATAKRVPERVVTNAELTQWLATSDDWIQSRTGIKQRHVACTETNADLATAVAQQLLAKSGVTPTQLAFIIVATMSPDAMTPGVANQVQGALGATQAAAFDLNAACAGFVHALVVADGLLTTPATVGLVIGSEVLSRLVDWQDRSTAVLFGDGAAGVVVTGGGAKIRHRLRSFGESSAALVAGKQANNSPFAPRQVLNPHFAMDGHAVFRFATKTVAQEIQAFGEVGDWLLLHQANARIIDSVAKKLALPAARLPQNLARYGNTSAASIPLLLHDGVQEDRFKRGARLVLCGFGGGLSIGICALTY